MTPREQWVAALRSGEFKQGRCRLEHRDGRLCCLGVACVVAERNGVPVERTATGRLNGETLRAQLPVAAWLGLHAWARYSLSRTLVDMNDGERAPFERIADYIEAQGEPT